MRECDLPKDDAPRRARDRARLRRLHRAPPSSARRASPTRIATCTGQRCVAGLNGGARICTHACSGQTGAARLPHRLRLQRRRSGEPDGPDVQQGDVRLRRRHRRAAALRQGLLARRAAPRRPSGTPPAPAAAIRRRRPPAATPPIPTRAPLRPRPSATTRTPTAPPAAHSDSDCPVDMYCGADYDGVTKCLRRAFCDPCWMNDNCTGGNDACVPTSRRQRALLHQVVRLALRLRRRAGPLPLLRHAPPTRSAQAACSACTSSAPASAAAQICDPCRTRRLRLRPTARLRREPRHRRAHVHQGLHHGRRSAHRTSRPAATTAPPRCNAGDPIYTDLCTGDANHYQPRRPDLLLLTRCVCKLLPRPHAHKR